MIAHLYRLNLKWIVRDRVLQALLGVALVFLVMVPVFSVLSMRQVQELSITISLSFISVVLLILAVLLGSSSIWRDIEKRYTAAVLTLPYSRSAYLLGKFLAIASFLIGSAVLLGIMSVLAISFSSGLYPSTSPIRWLFIVNAITFDAMKYILLAAVAVLFSSFSTSFFLPIFGTISLLLAGNASQEVFEFVTKDAGSKMTKPLVYAVNGLYYLIPNFGAFNFKVAAIYPVPLQFAGIVYTFLYFIVYLLIVLGVAIWAFSRREFS